LTKAKKAVLDLGSHIVFEQVKAFKDRFDKLIRSKSTLQIGSSQITEIDLTGIQLIQYFLLQAKAMEKELIFQLNISEENKNLLIKNGYSGLLEKITS